MNNGIECKECKEGYYKEGEQCYSCKNKIFPCDKCHKEVIQNGTSQYLKCDNCIGFYSPNENGTICQLDECEEYPVISPGYIICKNKLNEYKNSKKCQSCKYGYFKKEEDLCAYCRSEVYGGPSCYECGYEENEKGKRQIILYTKIVIHMMTIIVSVIIGLLPISKLLQRLYLQKENAIIAKIIYLIYA